MTTDRETGRPDETSGDKILQPVDQAAVATDGSGLAEVTMARVTGVTEVTGTPAVAGGPTDNTTGAGAGTTSGESPACPSTEPTGATVSMTDDETVVADPTVPVPAAAFQRIAATLREKDPQLVRGMMVGVVTNPVARRGHGRHFGEMVMTSLLSLEQSHGIALQDLTGTSALDSFQRILSAPMRLDALVVVGGDGMVSLGVNAALALGIPLGIVACGSGNDFARGIGLPINRIETTVTAIVAALTTRTSVAVDLGHVMSAEDGGARVDKYYAGQLSCGIDAQINLDANQSHLPHGAVRYLASAIREVSHLKAYGYAVTYEGVEAEAGTGPCSRAFEVNGPLLSVANSRFVGGGIELSPRSKVRDGLLDLLWTKWKPTGKQGMDLLKKAYQGEHINTEVIGFDQVTAVTIRQADSGDIPPIAMADGEVVGALPLRVEVAPAALQLLVPPSVEAVWQAV